MRFVAASVAMIGVTGRRASAFVAKTGVAALANVQPSALARSAIRPQGCVSMATATHTTHKEPVGATFTPDRTAPAGVNKKRISDKMEEMLNGQANKELQSSMKYLSFAYFCEDSNLDGFAKLFHAQSVEEREHADKIYKFILKRGGTPRIGDVAAPVMTHFKSVVDATKAYLTNERAVSDSIFEIQSEAHESKDWPTVDLMNWFVANQVEEEDKAMGLLEESLDYDQKRGMMHHLDAAVGASEA